MSEIAHLTLRLSGAAFPVDDFEFENGDLAERAEDGPYIPGQVKIVSIDDVKFQLQPNSCAILHHMSPSKDDFEMMLAIAMDFNDFIGRNQTERAVFTSHGHISAEPTDLAKLRERILGGVASFTDELQDEGAVRVDLPVTKPVRGKKSIRVDSAGSTGTHRGMAVVEFVVDQKTSPKDSVKKFIDELRQVGYDGFKSDLEVTAKEIADNE